MSELVQWMKDVYTKAKENNLNWKPVHPNNMPCNGIEGLYTDMFFEKDNKYEYIKFTIEYVSRCDEEGISHPDEGIKYYVLHELREFDLNEKFEIPEPTDEFDINNEYSCMVNNYGRFRYVFNDEETAKKVANKQLLHMLYPYTYILSEGDYKEWIKFLGEKDENNK